MKLGLLSESGQNVARIREQPTYVSFGHKLLQEWAGAYYIARCLERTTDIKVNITGWARLSQSLLSERILNKSKCKLKIL